MANMTVEYLGNLRCECTHIASGAKIFTDAPVDNKGKGEAFSPTDLCSTSLASCMMTIMGIYAQEHGCDVTGTKMTLSKVMANNPRRIGKIRVEIDMPDREFTEQQKKALEHCCNTCPVHLTLDPAVEQEIVLNWAK